MIGVPRGPRSSAVRADRASTRVVVATVALVRNDVSAKAVDPKGDPNTFSYHYRSRLDIERADGTRFACENLRAGCAGQPTSDGRPPDYSVFD